MEFLPNICYYANAIPDKLYQYIITVGSNEIVHAFDYYAILMQRINPEIEVTEGIQKYVYLLEAWNLHDVDRRVWYPKWITNLNDPIFACCLEPNRIYMLSKYTFILNKYSEIMTQDELTKVTQIIEGLKRVHLDTAGIHQANLRYYELNSLMQELDSKKSLILEELSKLKNNIDRLKYDPIADQQLQILKEKIRLINYVTPAINVKSPILDAVASLVEEKNPFGR